MTHILWVRKDRHCLWPGLLWPAASQSCVWVLETVSSMRLGQICGLPRGQGRGPHLTKNIALHWAGRGVRVNSVHPGFIDTPILDQARGTPIEQAMLDVTPMGRLGQPAEVAARVAYLASDDASFVTGLELCIDGGYTAR
jgi:hypothetical protein